MKTLLPFLFLFFFASNAFAQMSSARVAAKLQPNGVVLSWNAVRDENAALYSVERSSDGIHYNVVANVPATSVNTYSIIDVLQHFMFAKAYYRLSVNIAGGMFKYGPAVLVDVKQGGNASKITVAPNPVSSVMQLQIYTEEKQSARIVVLGPSGNPVLLNTQQLNEGNTALMIPGFQSMTAGIYTVKLILHGEVITKRFIVSK